MSSITYYYKLGEYPDLDSATVRSGRYKDGNILSKEDKVRFKDEYPEMFYQGLWRYIGQFGK
ncbi:MAG TPA: hypothetical protein VLB82_02725 [Thermodesulfobacteriota bacterium]|nr:hypothetical protein [Thermodesulfobacteriota bacterium]